MACSAPTIDIKMLTSSELVYLEPVRAALNIPVLQKRGTSDNQVCLYVVVGNYCHHESSRSCSQETVSIQKASP